MELPAAPGKLRPAIHTCLHRRQRAFMKLLHGISSSPSPGPAELVPLALSSRMASSIASMQRWARRFDQRQQASCFHSQGASAEQAAHQALLPQLLAGGSGRKQLLVQRLQR
jgi:hypothetical protein